MYSYFMKLFKSNFYKYFFDKFIYEKNIKLYDDEDGLVIMKEQLRRARIPPSLIKRIADWFCYYREEILFTLGIAVFLYFIVIPIFFDV